MPAPGARAGLGHGTAAHLAFPHSGFLSAKSIFSFILVILFNFFFVKKGKKNPVLSLMVDQAFHQHAAGDLPACPPLWFLLLALQAPLVLPGHTRPHPAPQAAWKAFGISGYLGSRWGVFGHVFPKEPGDLKTLPYGLHSATAGF